MARKSSITAELSLSTEAWKKGLRQASEETERWRRREQAAAAFNAGGATQSRTGLEAREAAARMGIAPMTGATGITGLKLKPGMGQPYMDPGFIDRTRASMQGLGRDTLTTNSAFMATKGGATNAGMGVLFLSNALQDATHGFVGLINNIPQIVMAFGGSAGLAAKTMLAAVGFDVLNKHLSIGAYTWDAYGKAMQKAWNTLTGEDAYQKQLASNAAAERAYEKNVARMQKEAEMQGNASAALMEDVDAAEERRRAADARALERRIEIMEMEKAIAAEKRAALDIDEREAANAADKKRMLEERVKLEERLYTELIANNAKTLKAAEERLSRLKTEMRNLDAKTEWTGPEKLRAAELRGELPALENSVQRQRGWNRSDREALERVQHEKRMLPQRKALIDLETENARKAREAAQKQRDTADAFNLMGDVADMMGDALKNAVATAEKLAADARRITETREDAQNAHLRARGRGAAADRRERRQTEARRARELQEQNPGMTAEEAAKLAQQERLDSRRTIRGAPARQFEGIDAFRRGSMKAPDFPGLDNRRATTKPARPTSAAAANAAGAEGPVEGKLSELVQIGRETVARLDRIGQNTTGAVSEKVAAAA